jgi:UDP-N-acetylglucosamine 4,6-dehydratase
MTSLDFLKNKTILVTGGSGSFGRNFVKYLLNYSQAKKIIVFSRDELKQYQMQREITDGRLRFFLGDIRDLPRLERAFHGVDIVLHAAALKQIPALEYNPFEAVKTNIIGSQNVIDAAIDQEVKKVLLISTDKAAQPINLYGSTKLCAEKLFISGNAYAGGATKFSCARYGNVIGSRGGIVEVLLNRPNSSKVFLTDERMTRFWIILEQSFELVSFALKNMAGGEIFIPKIPSMKLMELFEVIAPNAQVEIIGIRPGEKLHEVLLTGEEARHAVELKNCFIILPELFSADKRYKNHLAKGKKLPAEFCYTSDNNQCWLSKDELQNIIKKLN